MADLDPAKFHDHIMGTKYHRLKDTKCVSESLNIEQDLILSDYSFTDLVLDESEGRLSESDLKHKGRVESNSKHGMSHFVNQRLHTAMNGCVNQRHWRDRVYKRHRRFIAHCKPYDITDELNLNLLKISPTKPVARIKGTLRKHSTEKPSAANVINRPLIHPAQLIIKSEGDNISHLQSQAASKNFDFGSLAAQVSELECESSRHKTATFNWNEVRESLNPIEKRATCAVNFFSNDEDDDGLDELSSLSGLCLRSENSSEASQTSRTSPKTTGLVRSCSQEAMLNETDFSAEELAYYFDELVHIPRKMSEMAEMMYT